nr:bifunctional (p)ppGpp synthetase/guanosine-3',5'-bis(diphosphate) 3'-pyrophosphohydrolase [Dehalococcoides mccartyi]
MEFADLKEKASKYLPPEKLTLLEEAYNYAAAAHAGQMRKSGEPFIEHPLNVAMTLADLQLDAATLSAALLHDVPEDANISLEQIDKKFGADVAKLVDGVTKLSKLALGPAIEDARRPGGNASLRQAENLRKMLVAMAEDLRVVFIKLADRFHNMRTLQALSPEKRRSIAKETMEIYAPLAHRLGIWELKWQLEDLAFRYLDPRHYRQVANLVDSKLAQRQNYLEHVSAILQGEFEKNGLNVEVSGRPKHLYSIYQKMEKYASQGKQFEDIYDVLALRVLVNDIPDCYHAVGIVHSLWHPIPGAFDDYIANPKPNGYQSLHTAVMSLGTTPLEVQVRTYQMHHIAEYGVAAHWRYKTAGKEDVNFEDRVGWLRQLIEWHRDMRGAEEFLESVKTDIFNDQVFVFTPKGEIKDLAKGATPIDFAYRIHTELGNRCIGAKANGRLVPLDYQLKNGEVVEIVTTKKDRGPSRDWLNVNMGYIKTHHAREKILAWFKKQERTENLDRGRELLEKELKHIGIKTVDRDALAKTFKYENADEFLMAIGYGAVSVHQVSMKLLSQQEQPRVVTPPTQTTKPTSQSSVSVMGTGSLLTNIAKCCNPVPGDDIIGYVTRNRGVTVHRQDCHNILHEEERERLVSVDWGMPKEELYPASIRIQAWDRVGLVRDVSTVVAEEKISILSMTVTENDDKTTTLAMTTQIKSLSQLTRLMAKLEGIRGIISINRVGADGSRSG